MDGLLLDTEAMAQSAFNETCVSLGLLSASEFDPQALFLSLVGSSEDDTRRKLTAGLPDTTDLATFGALWQSVMRASLSDGVPPRPTVPEVLTGLSARGVPMAVVTSTRAAHARDCLAAAGLLGHFVAVIGGDMVPANKPDPAPFQIGARALGLAPEACVAFEDSDVGTQSAVSAGCQVWQIPDLRPPHVSVPRLGQNLAATLAQAVAEAGL